MQKINIGSKVMLIRCNRDRLCSMCSETSCIDRNEIGIVYSHSRDKDVIYYHVSGRSHQSFASACYLKVIDDKMQKHVKLLEGS